jgi:hypothetical protein
LLVGVTSTSFASTGGFAASPGSQGGGITSFNTHGNWSAFGVTSGATGTETAIKFYFGTTPTVVAYSTAGTNGFLTEFSSGTNRTVSSVSQNGPLMGSGYYQLSASATNAVYTCATYSAEL